MSKTRKWLVVGAAMLLVLALAPMALAQQEGPLIEVSDQMIENDTVTLDRVVSDGLGWVAVWSDVDGAPGDVLGYAQVDDGENTDVDVMLDELDLLTAMDDEQTFYASLHERVEGDTVLDETAAAFQQLDGQDVVETFTVTGLAEGVDDDEDAEGPQIEVSDQMIENDTVTLDRVVSDGLGWVAVWSDVDGAPGDVLGYAQVDDGENTDVDVMLDELDLLTAMDDEQTFYASLHERVEGDTVLDETTAAFQQLDGQDVVETFTVTGLAGDGVEVTPGALPEAGGSFVPGVWAGFVLLLVGAAALAASLGLAVMRRR